MTDSTCKPSWSCTSILVESPLPLVLVSRTRLVDRVKKVSRTCTAALGREGMSHQPLSGFLMRKLWQPVMMQCRHQTSLMTVYTAAHASAYLCSLGMIEVLRPAS